MRDCKLVWIASMPRAGSMWVYNVTRSLIAAAGRAVEPARVPYDKDEIAEAARKALSSSDPARIWVLKTHLAVRRDMPRSLFILPRRDARDALVSYMRFMGIGFDDALRRIAAAAGVVDHYWDGLPADTSLRLEYATIVADAEEAIRRIAGFLALDPSDEEVRRMAALWSREAVAKLLRRLEERAATQGLPADEVFRRGDGKARLYDRATGFQSGHASDYRDGDWRRLLPAECLPQIDARLGPWLARHGYPPTLGGDR